MRSGQAGRALNPADSKRKVGRPFVALQDASPDGLESCVFGTSTMREDLLYVSVDHKCRDGRAIGLGHPSRFYESAWVVSRPDRMEPIEVKGKVDPLLVERIDAMLQQARELGVRESPEERARRLRRGEPPRGTPKVFR